VRRRGGSPAPLPLRRHGRAAPSRAVPRGDGCGASGQVVGIEGECEPCQRFVHGAGDERGARSRTPRSPRVHGRERFRRIESQRGHLREKVAALPAGHGWPRRGSGLGGDLHLHPFCDLPRPISPGESPFGRCSVLPRSASRSTRPAPPRLPDRCARPTPARDRPPGASPAGACAPAGR